MVITGTKTQTRRVINPQPMFPRYNGPAPDGTFEFCSNSGHQYEYYRPRYHIVEDVYLKEPYAIFYSGNDYSPDHLLYRFDKNDPNNPIKWKNKLFMPESAARYFIEITNVKVERLQDISERDCMKEGIKESPWYNLETFKHPFYNGIDKIPYYSAKDAYKYLINAIDGKDTWDNNPFVFVYDFKLTTR